MTDSKQWQLLTPNQENFPPANVMFVAQVLFVNLTFNRVLRRTILTSFFHEKADSVTLIAHLNIQIFSVDTEDFRINSQKQFNLDLTQMTLLLRLRY